MLDWFFGLSVIGKIWIIYLFLGAMLFAGAAYFEFTVSSKVNGAGGWLLFAAIMVVGAYGLPVMILLTGIIWLVQRFL